MTDSVLDTEIARDYLAGRLSESATREFEGRVTRDPALVRTLEELLRFREGLEVLRERGELAPLLRAAPRRTRWLLPLAAAAAVAAIALFLGLPSLSRAPVVGASIAELRLGGTQPHGVVAQFSFAAVRQADAPPVLDLPAAGPLAIRVLVPGTAGDAFRVVLTRREGAAPSREIAALSGVRRDESGFVTIYADAARIAPGDYAASASPEPGERGVDLPFRLRSATAGATPPR